MTRPRLAFAFLAAFVLTMALGQGSALAAFGLTKLRQTTAAGAENYIYTSGEVIFPEADPDSNRFYKMVVRDAGGTVRNPSFPCTATNSFGSANSTYTVQAADPVSNAADWTFTLNQYTNSSCSSLEKTASLSFNLARATSFSDSSLTTQRSLYPAAATAFVTVAGLQQSTTDFSTTWILPANVTACANNGGSDRPDSSSAGVLPSTAGGFLQYRPGLAGAAWNLTASYDSVPVCPAFDGTNDGAWKVKLQKDSTHFVTLPVFTVDATAPGVTLTSPAHGSSTNDATPALSGAAGNASGDSSTVTVRIYSGSTATGTPVQTLTPTRSGASWSTTAAALPPGTYTARAEQADSAGNTGQSSANTFTVDTSAPSPTLTAPANGSSGNDTTPALSGAAGNASGDGATVTVRIYSGSTATGTPVQTLTPTRSGASWNATAATLAPGTYTAQAEQSDAAGNTGQSSANTFTVDTSAPGVTLTTPANGAFTNDTTPALTGAAGNAAGDGTTVTVRIYAGATATGTPVQTLTPTRSGASWSTTAAALTPGTYTARAEQSDAAGNSGQSSANTFTVDTSAPSPTLTTPANGAFTNDTTPALSGAAGNATGDGTTVTVHIYAGSSASGTPVQTLTPTRSGASWSTTATVLAAGTYTARAEQSDAAGNTGQSPANTFTVDTANPTVAVTLDPASPDGANGFYTQAPTVHASADDTTGLDALSCTVDGTPTALTNTSSTTTHRQGDVPVSGDGEHTVVCTAEDAAGNSANDSETFKQDESTPAPTLTSPADGASTNDATPILSGAAGNAAGDSSTVTVKIYAGPTATGTPVQTLTPTRSGAGWATTASPALADGTYTARAEQTDSAGHAGQSGTRTFSVDTDGPNPTLTTPADGSSTNDTTPALSGTAGNAGGDSSTVTVKIYAGTTATGSPVQTLTPTRAGTSWTAGAATLGQGTYTARAEQVDAAGNTGLSGANTFTVDTADPTVTLTSPGDGSATNDSTPSLSGAAGNANGDSITVTVKVYAGSSATGTPVQTLNPARAGSTWNASPASLDDGTYTAQAEQADAAGNVGQSAARTFRVDTAAPALTLADPQDGSSTSDITPDLSGGAGNATGDSTSVTIRIYAGDTVGGSPLQTLSPTRTGSTWTASAGTLAEGVYTAQAEQTDSAGNSGQSAAHTFTIDTTGPEPTLTDPADGFLTNDATPTLSGGAGDLTGDSDTVTVNVYAGPAATGSPVRTLSQARSGASWSTDISPALADGTYTARAEQQDAAGNDGQSTPHTFVVDTAAPAVTVASPADGSATNDTTPTLSGAAGDAASDAAVVTTRIYSGSGATGAPVQTLNPARTGPSWAAEPSPALEEGTYTTLAQQLDAAGNTGQSSAHTFTIDTTDPTVESANDARTYTQGDNVSADFTCSDAGSGIQSCAGTVAKGAKLNTASLGDQSFEVTAGDKAGNSAARTIAYKVVANLPPTASFTLSPSAPVAGQTVTFTSSSSDGDGPLQSEAWDLDGDGQFGDASGHSATRSFAVAGTYTVALRVTDRLGASSSAFQTFTVAPAPAASQARARYLDPFPVVHLRGRTTARGARLTLLTVTAAPGATTTVRCSGRGCPLGRQTKRVSVGRRSAQLLRFRRFERFLRAGVVLRITTTKPGFIGKHTRIVIRRMRPPLRSDRCLVPGSSKPVACPPG